MQILKRAVEVYERLKQLRGGLDFNDLLIATRGGLRDHAHLREYFHKRYTHLLIDEFQDTDPVQAEIAVLLASDDASQSDWQKCQLRRGGLFVVGDPKQSIYRFRRGDIVTYSQVKNLIASSGGKVLPLTLNFRSDPSLIEWNNACFESKFPRLATDLAPAFESMAAGVENLQPAELRGVFKLTAQTTLPKPKLKWSRGSYANPLIKAEPFWLAIRSPTAWKRAPFAPKIF